MGGKRILVAGGNRYGWPLEALLEQVRRELADGVELLEEMAPAPGTPARAVLRNTQQLVGLLQQAEALHRASLDQAAAAAATGCDGGGLDLVLCLPRPFDD